MSEEISIVQRAKEVADKAQFVDFLRALHADLEKRPEEWENRTLGDYLEGMSRFTAAIEGYYSNRKESVDLERPSWRVLAEILVAASVYQ